MTYTPDPRPVGDNSKSNEFYAKQNHVRPAKSEVTKGVFTNVGGPFAVAINGLTNNPSYGLTAQIGVNLTVVTDGMVVGPLTYSWKADGAQVSTANNFTPGTAIDLQSLVVEVTDPNAAGGSYTATSRAYTVRYAPPVNTVAPVVTGDTAVGSVLTSTEGTWTAPGATTTYQWSNTNGIIAGATSSTYTTQASDAGLLVACEVTKTSSGGSTSEFSNTITVDGFSVPVNIVAPVASKQGGGSANAGDTLETTDGTWSGNPTPTYTYQWRRNGSNISGATANTYVTTQPGGHDCVVTATNSQGSANANSNSVSVGEALAAPSNITPASIPTTGTVGQAIIATAGNWQGNPTPTVTGQWRKGITNISGETGLSYTPDEARSDYNYLESATNSEGTTVQASNFCDVESAGDIAPTWVLGALQSGGGGNPDSVTVTSWSKNGSTDTHTAWIATANTATPATKAQIRAGTGGGIIQSDSNSPYDGEQVDLTGFSTNAGVTHLQYFAEENNNGGSNVVQVLAISGFDFEAPTISSATIENATPAVVDVVADKNLLGTTSAAAWAVSTKTVSSTSFTPPSTDVGVTLSADVTEGEALTIDYTGTTLTNDRGKPMATQLGTSITNNVAPGPSGYIGTDDFNRADDSDLSDSPNWTRVQVIGSGSFGVVSNQLTAKGAGANAGNTYRWVEPGASAISADQFVESRWVQTGSNNNNWLQMNLRQDATDTVAYQIRLQPGQIRIFRRVGGAGTEIYNDTGLGVPAEGTLVRFQVSGDGQVEWFFDNVSEGTIDDSGNSGPTDAGNVGYFLRTGGSPFCIIDDFRCGDIAAL